MSAIALNAESSNAALTVNDLQQSIKFYTEGLGFEIVHRHEHEGKLRYVRMQGGQVTIGIGQDDFAKGRDRKKGVGMRFWFTTHQDLDALAAQIKAAGFAIARGPAPTNWNSTELAVVDPDGFNISFEKPA
jgi:catechol 2,3-dioxygenase-like lactoylglutathione lyase family enzyme